MKDIKKRYWAGIVYPDSLPADWLQILTDTGLPIAISPLHDADINETTNEQKKPHYHVIMAWSGPQRESNALNIITRLNGAKQVKGLESIKGAYRYLTHKDNPEKAQYDEKDIRTLNGFDIKDFADLTASELAKVRAETVSLINERDITEYADLIDVCFDEDLSDILDYAATHTYFTDRYITSRRNKREKGLKEAENRLKVLAGQLHESARRIYETDIVTSEDEKKVLELFGEFERIEQGMPAGYDYQPEDPEKE